ncbi:MAG: glycogen synthase [Blastocatellia bacterium]
MRVILASSEVVPYAKTGGLADVSGALPGALRRIGCDIAVVTPRYTSDHGPAPGRLAGARIIESLSVPFAGTWKTAAVWRDDLDGVPVYFIENHEYFGGGYIYGSGDFDVERFAFFSRATLELSRQLGAPPGIIHCNDWQTGLIPAYLRYTHAGDPFFRHTATLFTIHNLAYQGLFSPALLPRLGFGAEAMAAGLEFHGAASAMKSGLAWATALSTVSRKYAEETQTPEYGNRLDGLLRRRRDDYIGILNGVDYGEWNPETDPHIAAPFSIKDLAGKRECKRALLREFHLPDTAENMERPLVGIVTRLTVQKGIDLIAQAIWRMLDAGVSFVLLGSGGQSYEDFFQHVRDTRPHQVGVYFGYKEDLAHRIEAGSDMFLMPSAYEPCGLNQMYSLKYGSAPLVRGTGGLDDTIENFDPLTGRGNGFKFHEYSADKLLEKFYEALMVWYDKDLWQRLIANGMQADFSWERAAGNYLSAYELIRRRAG